MGLCKCSGNQVIVTSTPSSDCAKNDCIFVPHLLIGKENSIYPCGEDISIDVSDKIKFKPGGDKSIAEFEILSYSSNLTNVYFEATGDRSIIKIRATSAYSGYPEPDYKFATISYKVQQGILSDAASVTIVFKNACDTKLVPTNSICNPCTGIITSIVDLEIGNVGIPDLEITIN